MFVPVCCKWANMLSHQPNTRPCTASLRPAGHIQRTPCFFQDQCIWGNDEWRTKTLRPIENEWDLRKSVLHSCLKRTSLQEEELKKRPVSVCAAAATHGFIDPSCRWAPLFCQCVSLNTHWALQKEILYKKGPKGLKLASLHLNNKQSSSPPRPPNLTLLAELFPLQAEVGLLGVGLSSSFQKHSWIQSKAGEGDSLPWRLLLDTPTPCCTSPPQQEKQQPAVVSIRPFRLELAVTDCIYHLI